jgi:hypothetical protein
LPVEHPALAAQRPELLRDVLPRHADREVTELSPLARREENRPRPHGAPRAIGVGWNGDPAARRRAGHVPLFHHHAMTAIDVPHAVPTPLFHCGFQCLQQRTRRPAKYNRRVDDLEPGAEPTAD